MPIKGKKREKADQYAENTLIDEAEEGSRAITPSVDCWEFALEDVTDAVASVQTSEIVAGSIVDNRVLVLSLLHGALGFAPSETGQAIVNTLATAGPGTSLQGQVMSTEGESVLVRLCLSS